MTTDRTPTTAWAWAALAAEIGHQGQRAHENVLALHRPVIEAAIADSLECLECGGRAALRAEPRAEGLVRLTHGRHCRCTPCANEDWTNPKLAHCGMHGPSCPAVYGPYDRKEYEARAEPRAEGLREAVAFLRSVIASGERLSDTDNAWLDARLAPEPDRTGQPSMTVTEPTFDSDGYPTDETLERIKTWPIKTNDDFGAAMDFAGRAWSYPDRWECIERWEDPDWPSYPKRVYRFSTGGWSGNESLVDAIEANDLLQMIGAWSWQRGGHYEYRFPIVTDGVATAALLAEPVPS